MEWKLTYTDTNLVSLEKKLWQAADQLRSNSNLTAQEYSRPILGLIFLKYADYRFTLAKEQVMKKFTGKRRKISKIDFQVERVIYLQYGSHFSYFATLLEESDFENTLIE